MGHEEDVVMAMDSLKEEIEGIKAYNEYIELVQCPDLKMLMTKAMDAERVHAKGFLNWINANLQI
jgi:hypothetical protein